MTKRKHYFYCEKYNDGYWDYLEDAYDREYLINNYTQNGVPSNDVDQYEVMEFEIETYSEIFVAEQKCIAVIDARNIKQLEKDELKKPALMKTNVYNEYLKKLGFKGNFD